MTGRSVGGFDWLAPILLGACSFFLVAGHRILDPGNIAWLEAGDPATHYLGWTFFRDGPWTMPLGSNPRYGLDLGSSILLSDSHPLLAFIFKPLSGYLPAVFQYFGAWIFACFLLQSWFAWKLTGLFAEDRLQRLLAAGLFVFAPPMLWRLYGHLALFGHFIIVAALYVRFNPRPRQRWPEWAALLTIAALVTPYFLAMVLALWLSDLIGRVRDRPAVLTVTVVEAVATMLWIAVVAWQAGYFTASPGVGGGAYGVFHFNLLDPLNAEGWSYVLESIPRVPDHQAGSNFLGLGVILLLLWALPVARLADFRKFAALTDLKVVGPVLFCLTAFAITNSIGIGSYLISLPLPEALLNAAATFRASERMFWPAFYCIVLLAIFLVVAGYARQTARLLLAAALLVQVVDTSAAWRGIRNRLMVPPASEWTSPLVDPFWDAAAERYRKLRIIPPRAYSSDWASLAYYAATHGLATNAVYLARVDGEALAKSLTAASRTLETGRYKRNTLYVLDEHAVPTALAGIDPSRDLIARVDGRVVVAPGWKECAKCPAVNGELPE